MRVTSGAYGPVSTRTNTCCSHLKGEFPSHRNNMSPLPLFDAQKTDAHRHTEVEQDSRRQTHIHSQSAHRQAAITSRWPAEPTRAKSLRESSKSENSNAVEENAELGRSYVQARTAAVPICRWGPKQGQCRCIAQKGIKPRQCCLTSGTQAPYFPTGRQLLDFHYVSPPSATSRSCERTWNRQAESKEESAVFRQWKRWIWALRGDGGCEHFKMRHT